MQKNKYAKVKLCGKVNMRITTNVTFRRRFGDLGPSNQTFWLDYALEGCLRGQSPPLISPLLVGPEYLVSREIAILLLVRECLVVLSFSFSILSRSSVSVVPCLEASLLLLPLGQLLLQQLPFSDQPLLPWWLAVLDAESGVSYSCSSWASHK
jgi:hypothetical protein